MNFGDVQAVRSHLADSSRKLMDLTASMVYDNPQLFKLLIEVTLMDEDPWSNRASRVVNICSTSFPEMFRPYCSRIIRSLQDIRSEGVIRNYLKTIAEIPLKLTMKDKTRLLNLCFDYLTGNQPVAIKVFSMEILYNLSLEMPEIGMELSSIIGENLLDASAGYRSRGEKILKKLQRLNFR